MRIVFLFLGCSVLGLALFSCSGPKQTNKPGDAAFAEAGNSDGEALDLRSQADLEGPAAPPDLAPADGSLRDVPIADTRIGEDTAGDLPAGPVDGPADMGGTELSTGDLSSVDSSGDLAVPCGPDGGGCNDDSWYTGGWSACNTNGTCVCKVGFEINPKTGRCRAMTPM
jgi:hypothetical protein